MLTNDMREHVYQAMLLPLPADGFLNAGISVQALPNASQVIADRVMDIQWLM